MIRGGPRRGQTRRPAPPPAAARRAQGPHRHRARPPARAAPLPPPGVPDRRAAPAPDPPVPGRVLRAPRPRPPAGIVLALIEGSPHGYLRLVDAAAMLTSRDYMPADSSHEVAHGRPAGRRGPGVHQAAALRRRGGVPRLRAHRHRPPDGRRGVGSDRPRGLRPSPASEATRLRRGRDTAVDLDASRPPAPDPARPTPPAIPTRDGPGAFDPITGRSDRCSRAGRDLPREQRAPGPEFSALTPGAGGPAAAPFAVVSQNPASDCGLWPRHPNA